MMHLFPSELSGLLAIMLTSGFVLSLVIVLLICQACFRKKPNEEMGDNHHTTSDATREEDAQFIPQWNYELSMVGSNKAEQWKSLYESQSNLYAEEKDNPQREFAAMRASVQANKASGISISRKGSKASRLVTHAQIKSMESMPKMGIPPRKITAGYIPFANENAKSGQEMYASGFSGARVNNSSYTSRLDSRAQLEVISEDFAEPTAPHTQVSGSKLTATTLGSKHKFGPASENAAERIFGIPDIQTMTDLFKNERILSKYETEPRIKSPASSPQLESRIKKKRRHYGYNY